MSANCIVSLLLITFLLKLMHWWTLMFGKMPETSHESEGVRDLKRDLASDVVTHLGEEWARYMCSSVTSQMESKILLPLNFWKVLKLPRLFLHRLHQIEPGRGDLKWKGLFYHHLCWACFKQTHNSVPKTWKSFFLHTSFFSDAQLRNVVFKGFLTWLSGFCTVGKMNHLLA